ncbi:MAG TPA: creatininase family protein [Quisquiliibacterium sp.]|nr:creatininase family protein [Quisquiliibacterium sp.]
MRALSSLLAAWAAQHPEDTHVPNHRPWASLTWKDFDLLDRDRTVAVLPVAAIEQHGPHLPLDVDARINEGVLAAALARTSAVTPLLVLPAFVVGKSDEHAAFPGTLTLSTQTLSQVWFEIGESVHRAGLRKIVFVNSHGGQSHVARIVAQDLRVRLGMVAVVASTYGFGEPAGLFPAEELRHGIHGGAVETSLMLHLAPETVRTDLVDAFPPGSVALEASARELRFHGNGALAWATQDLHPSGACGDARQASARAGAQVLEHVASRLATLLDEVAAYPAAALRDGPARIAPGS